MMTQNFDEINHLVLNFYPDGYSIAVKLNEFPVFTSETILETAKISYEETSLLDYIENEELPPLLVEMIDGSPKLSQYKIWHRGCLILEVRDKISKLNGDSYFILLKPTNLSMLNDVICLTESNLWSAQDRLQLESQIVLYNSPPLHLEPDATNNQSAPCPERETANIHTRHKKKLPHTKFKEDSLDRNGQTKTDRMGSCSKSNGLYSQSSQDILPPELTLQQFLAVKRAKRRTPSSVHLARFNRFRRNQPYNNNIN